MLKEKKQAIQKTKGVTKEYLEKAAYYHWLQRGSPIGDPLIDWVAAEKEVLNRRSWRNWWFRSNRELEPFDRAV